MIHIILPARMFAAASFDSARHQSSAETLQAVRKSQKCPVVQDWRPYLALQSVRWNTVPGSWHLSPIVPCLAGRLDGMLLEELHYSTAPWHRRGSPAKSGEVPAPV